MTIVYSWLNSPNAVKQQHAILNSLLDALESRLQSHEPANRSLVSLFNSLACHLQMHFEFEESDELLSGLVRHAPRLSGQIARLRAEQTELLTSVDTLIEKARRAFAHHCQATDVARLYSEFQRQFTEHEEAEQRVLKEASGIDKGGRDEP